MGDNLCEPISGTVFTAANERADHGISPREGPGILCDADFAEHRVPRNMDCVIDIHTDTPSQPVASTAAQSPIVNMAHSPLSNPDDVSNANTLLLCLCVWVCTRVMQTLSILLFPASKWYRYHLLDCTPEEGAIEQAQENSIRREKALESIVRSWKNIQSICMACFSPVAALSLLHLDDILSNIAIFTFIASAILLAMASVISSFAYSLGEDQFIRRWKTESEGQDTSFWRCISMPLDFAIWSFIFFISTIFMLIYERVLPTQADATIPQPAINSPQPVGAAFVAILSVIIACKIYYGLKYFYRRK
ncbi:hypothetical protein CPC08DRAFT_758240 [Agrocybe pediades]|nr:hypothetical protein CPC08DRAFT_758240 [Agrocybe pediades]